MSKYWQMILDERIPTALHRAHPVGSRIKATLGRWRVELEVLGHPAPEGPGVILARNVETGVEHTVSVMDPLNDVAPVFDTEGGEE